MGGGGGGAGRGIQGNWKMEYRDGPSPTWWSDVVRKLAENEDDERIGRIRNYFSLFISVLTTLTLSLQRFNQLQVEMVV
jgi:hypothetical protein